MELIQSQMPSRAVTKSSAVIPFSRVFSTSFGILPSFLKALIAKNCGCSYVVLAHNMTCPDKAFSFLPLIQAPLAEAAWRMSAAITFARPCGRNRFSGSQLFPLIVFLSAILASLAAGRLLLAELFVLRIFILCLCGGFIIQFFMVVCAGVGFQLSSAYP